VRRSHSLINAALVHQVFTLLASPQFLGLDQRLVANATVFHSLNKQEELMTKTFALHIQLLHGEFDDAHRLP
jgi:hypothetical protein